MCILSTGPMLTGEILMGEPRGEGELTRETQAVTHARHPVTHATQAVTHAVTHARHAVTHATQAVTHAVTHAVIQAAA